MTEGDSRSTATGSVHLVSLLEESKITRRPVATLPAEGFQSIASSQLRRDGEELELLMLVVCQVGAPAQFWVQMISEWTWIDIGSGRNQAQLLDDIKKFMAAEGWTPGDNHFTNGVDRLELAHPDGGYIFLSFDASSSNTLEIHSMSDCYYLPGYGYKDDFQ
jgi:hypothetical protein